MSQKEIKRIAKLRIKLQEERDLINEQRRVLRKELRENSFRKELVNSVKEMAKTQFTTPVKKITPKVKGDTIYIMEADGQLLGAKTLPHLRKTFATITQKVNESKAKHLVFLQGGDTVEGSHRASSMKSVDKNAIDQAILYGTELNKWLNEISKKVKVSVYMVTADNHGEVRSVGMAGETPEDNVLKIIAVMAKENAKGNPNLTISAQPVFYELKLPGTTTKVSLAHGNFAIHKNLLKFKQFTGNATVHLFGHLHHISWVQHPGYDHFIAPSSKLHIEEYEINGGYAQIDPKTGKAFRTPQIVELQFENNRISMVNAITIK